MVMRVVIGRSIITECGGGQCRALGDPRALPSSDPPSPVAAVRLFGPHAPLRRAGPIAMVIFAAINLVDVRDPLGKKTSPIRKMR
jgi:hypothetical protein